MPRDYHELPDEAHTAAAPEPLPADFYFADSQPPTDPDLKKSGGRFVRGFDPRRHKFTREECSRGFWTALAVWGVSMGAKLHAAGRWPNYRKA
jgi:hypothetical protein